MGKIIMRWIKKGLVFNTDHNFPWMISHSQVPIVRNINEEKLRIYFGTRDAQNRSTITFIDVDSDAPNKVLYIHDKQVLGLGTLGML